MMGTDVPHLGKERDIRAHRRRIVSSLPDTTTTFLLNIVTTISIRCQVAQSFTPVMFCQGRRIDGRIPLLLIASLLLSEEGWQFRKAPKVRSRTCLEMR